MRLRVTDMQTFYYTWLLMAYAMSQYEVIKRTNAKQDTGRPEIYGTDVVVKQNMRLTLRDNHLLIENSGSF